MKRLLCQLATFWLVTLTAVFFGVWPWLALVVGFCAASDVGDRIES